MSARGLLLAFLGAGAFFGFAAGVSASSDSSSSDTFSSMSTSEFSSSEMSLAFFFGAAFALGFAAADPAGRPRGFAGAAAFFGAALGFATFAGGAKSELAPSEKSSMESSMVVESRCPQGPAGQGCSKKKKRPGLAHAELGEKERVEAERGVALEMWSGVDLFIILNGGACFGNAAARVHSLD